MGIDNEKPAAEGDAIFSTESNNRVGRAAKRRSTEEYADFRDIVF